MTRPETDLMSFSCGEIFLGRQPILDQKRRIFAYELLFRSEDSLLANVEDDLQATSTVIVNTLSQFGLDAVLGKNIGFINVSASLLMSETLELLPPDRIVLEILEDVPMTQAVLTRCEALKALGFRLALDDFNYRTEYDPILPLVDFIKYDLTLTPLAQLKMALPLIRKKSNAVMLAEKVEQIAVFEACKELGFQLFQGYFFAKPSVLRSKKPQPSQMALMRIMGLLLGDANVSDLEPLFKDNPSLTLSLLRLVNSVGIGGGRQQISSLRQAIVVLGQKQLMRWIQLLLYASPDGGASNSLMQQVANRARLMELLAQQVESPVKPISDQAFMTGMLSLADAVMQIPLEEVFQQIGLADEIREAVLQRTGTLGDLLNLAEAIETGDFATASRVTHALGLSASELTNLELQAIQWSTEIGKI